MSEADESYDGAMKRAHRAEAKVRELDALLKEWLETPYFETLLEWQEWVDDFRPRVIAARDSKEARE